MITIDTIDDDVLVTVLGEFTLADFKEFEEFVSSKVQVEGAVNLMVDLSEMLSFTVDMAVEEIRFSRQHAADFRRIAVVTTSEWVTWSAWLSQVFVAADMQVFHDPDEARDWLDA